MLEEEDTIQRKLGGGDRSKKRLDDDYDPNSH